MSDLLDELSRRPRFYPVMLDLSGQLAVVIGGGAVGRRKIDSLLTCGARVRLVEPQAGNNWPAGVQVVAAEYHPSHLEQAALVFACTDDARVNARVADDAKALGLWVNVADDPEASVFHTPAVHYGNGLVLAVSTLGRAPAAAMTLRDALVASLPKDAECFAAAVAALRERVKEHFPEGPARAETLRRISGAEALAAFHRGGPEALEALLRGGHEDVVGMDGG